MRYYTSEVPPYRRLSPQAAARKWEADFSILEKEQRDSCDAEGHDAGKASWLHQSAVAMVKL